MKNYPKQRPTKYPPQSRIIALGDIHGDWNVLLQCLQLADLITPRLNWKGGNTHLVQIGDLFDRGGRSMTVGDEMSEWKILTLLLRLQHQSVRMGGGVHILVGNHELMNVDGDFRYTTPLSRRDFNGQRSTMLRPGGDIARILAYAGQAVVQIGGWLFSHAGILPSTIKKYRLSTINHILHEYLLGKRTREQIYHDRPLQDIFWTRRYGTYQPDCKSLYKVGRQLSLKGQVVGHTVQRTIHSKCNQQLWRIDVGMSRAFGSPTRYQVLEINDDGKRIRVLSTRHTKHKH